MGNTQSAEAPRRPPTKLTKPRTNTSTSNLLAISSAPSRRSSTMSLSTVRNNQASTTSLGKVTVDGDNTAPKKNTSNNRKQRRSMFRSKSAQPEYLVPVEEPLSDFEANITSNPLHRYSSMSSVRADVMGDANSGGSSGRPPIRISRSAQTYFPQVSQPARLSLVIEAQSPEPDPQEEMKQLGTKHGSFDDGVRENSTSPIERSDSHDSMPIPIRRRSLLTPGVATRKSSREKVVRKSLPAQPSSEIGKSEYVKDYDKRKFRRTLPAQATMSQDLLRQYYDQSKPTSSPLEEIAAIDTKRFSDIQQPRTATPNDLEYSHIGAFKLGSLRITNGTVSPEPSGPDSSYFETKIQTQYDIEEVRITQTELSQGEEDGVSEHTHDEIPSTLVETKNSRVRFEFHEVTEDPPKIVQTMVEIPTSSLELPDFRPVSSARQAVLVQAPATSYEMAQAYMQEIATSPFSFEESASPSPRFEVTSKPTEMEDNLFDDETGSAASLVVPILKNYSQKSIERQLYATSASTPPVNPSNSAESLHKVLQGPRQQSSKPLEKADSGYSSKTSLRSLGSRRSLTEFGVSSEMSTSTAPAIAQVAPRVPHKTPPPTPPKHFHTSYFNEVSIASSTFQLSNTRDREQAPPTPPKDRLSHNFSGPSEASNSSPTSHELDFAPTSVVSRPPYRQAPPVPEKEASSTRIVWTGPPPLPIKSIEQTQAAAKSSVESLATTKPRFYRRQSTPLPAYGQTMRPGLKPSASDTSISTISRKLQKRASATQVDVVVQGYTEIEPARIPPVSHEVSEHLEERLKNFPTLTHTYKSVQRTNSKETLATIFSMASTDQQADERQIFARFRGLIPNAPSNDEIEQSVKVELQSTSVSHGQRFSLMPKIIRKSVEKRSRRRSLENMSRNRSSSRDAQDREICVTNLTAHSANPGATLPDIAGPVLVPISGNRSNDIPTSSKHGNNPRGRTIGMDSQSAARFARDRSISRENERRRSPRRQSYEGSNSSEERSRFMADPTPPLPNINIGNNYEYPLPKKAKSPPPVSMKIPRKRMASPPPKPSRSAPNAPVEIPRLPDMDYLLDRRENGLPDAGLQQNPHVLYNGKQSARETLLNARQSINPARPEDSIATVQQQRNSPSLQARKRSSFEQLSRPSELTQRSHSYLSAQDRHRSHNHQPYDALQSRRDERSLARVSFDSSTENDTRNAHPLSQSHSYTQMRSESLNVDRYNNGFAYGYEPGYGVGGSAGTRNGDTTASRKGLPGSLQWGIDLSDVPIMVVQRNDGLQV